MHAKIITESKVISYFKFYPFEYYRENIPYIYLFRVRCLDYVLQLYNEKLTLVQIKML